MAVENNPPRVETINELNIWLDGQFKLVGAAQKAAADEIARIRDSVHETANHVAGLLVLNIPDKLQRLSDEVKAHDSSIDKMAEDFNSFKTAVRTAYAAIGIAGTVVGAITAFVVQFFR